MTSQQGISLLEVLIVIAILGILAAIAAPNYRDMIERQRLKQALESLKADMQFARTEALKRSQNIVVSRRAGGNGTWCYGLAVNRPGKTSCDCTQTDEAAANFCEIKRVLGSDMLHTTLEAAAVNNNTFNFRRGTISAGGVTFSSEHYAGRVVFSDVGRVRVCIPTSMPAGKQALPGYTQC